MTINSCQPYIQFSRRSKQEDARNNLNNASEILSNCLTYRMFDFEPDCPRTSAVHTPRTCSIQVIIFNDVKKSLENVWCEASRGAGAQSVTVKPIGCGFDPRSRRRNIYLYLYFHSFALVSRQRAALSSASQHAMPPELGGKWERSVLTLGSICLRCCVRDTAWGWFYFYVWCENIR